MQFQTRRGGLAVKVVNSVHTSWRLKTQVLIPAQDYNIDPPKLKTISRDSNSRMRVDMCCSRYKADKIQAGKIV